jgi:hypothetical protein
MALHNKAHVTPHAYRIGATKRANHSQRMFDGGLDLVRQEEEWALMDSQVMAAPT